AERGHDHERQLKELSVYDARGVPSPIRFGSRATSHFPASSCERTVRARVEEMTMSARRGLIGILAFSVLTHCAKDPALPPAQTPAAAAPSAAPAVAATTASPAAPVASAAAPVKEAYPVCVGQNLAEASPPARSGAVTTQLAPAFLDRMADCKTEDALPK